MPVKDMCRAMKQAFARNAATHGESRCVAKVLEHLATPKRHSDRGCTASVYDQDGNAREACIAISKCTWKTSTTSRSNDIEKHAAINTLQLLTTELQSQTSPTYLKPEATERKRHQSQTYPSTPYINHHAMTQTLWCVRTCSVSWSVRFQSERGVSAG